MSGRYEFTDADGDTLEVSEGNLGAVLTITDDQGEWQAVAIRYATLPNLIAALQEIEATK